MQSETYYHIYNRANGFENLFQSDENYNYFLRQWAKYIEPVAETYAYCLMPNHFHFLIRTAQENNVTQNLGYTAELPFGKFQTFQKVVSKQFSNLFSSYSQAYNKMYHRKGSLFSPNFKRKEITNDPYLTNVIFYIHYNPVHHGFTKQLEDWKHSSYHSLFTTKNTRIKKDQVNDWFGGKEELKKFHGELQALNQLEKLEMEFT